MFQVLEMNTLFKMLGHDIPLNAHHRHDYRQGVNYVYCSTNSVCNTPSGVQHAALLLVLRTFHYSKENQIPVSHFIRTIEITS